MVLIIPDDDSFARVETCRMNLLWIILFCKLTLTLWFGLFDMLPWSFECWWVYWDVIWIWLWGDVFWEYILLDWRCETEWLLFHSWMICLCCEIVRIIGDWNRMISRSTGVSLAADEHRFGGIKVFFFMWVGMFMYRSSLDTRQCIIYAYCCCDSRVFTVMW